jgi:nitrite reductase (NO-forming)
MFDWQYELQKRLQKPQVINYSQQEFEEEVEEEVEEHNVTTTTTESKEIQERAEDISLSKDSTLATNITDTKHIGN